MRPSSGSGAAAGGPCSVLPTDPQASRTRSALGAVHLLHVQYWTSYRVAVTVESARAAAGRSSRGGERVVATPAP